MLRRTPPAAKACRATPAAIAPCCTAPRRRAGSHPRPTRRNAPLRMRPRVHRWIMICGEVGFVRPFRAPSLAFSTGPPWPAGHFLLLVQEKVTKEKDTPGGAPYGHPALRVRVRRPGLRGGPSMAHRSGRRDPSRRSPDGVRRHLRPPPAAPYGDPGRARASCPPGKPEPCRLTRRCGAPMRFCGQGWPPLERGPHEARRAGPDKSPGAARGSARWIAPTGAMAQGRATAEARARSRTRSAGCAEGAPPGVSFSLVGGVKLEVQRIGYCNFVLVVSASVNARANA
jgi:hypothetical protein